MRWPHVVSAAGVVLGVLAIGMIGLAIRQENQTVPIIVAKHTIPPYTKIQLSDLKSVPVNKNDVIPNGVLDASNIVGHMTNMSIPVNTQIQASELSTAKSYQQLLQIMDVNHDGLVEALIPTSGNSLQGMSQVVNPGDKVILSSPSVEIPDVTVLSTPTTSQTFGVSQTNGNFIVALPLSEYNEIKGDLDNLQILLMDPSDTYDGLIPSGGMGTDSSEPPVNNTSSSQNITPTETNSSQSPGHTATSSVKSNVPQYFAPPKGKAVK